MERKVPHQKEIPIVQYKTEFEQLADKNWSLLESWLEDFEIVC